MPDTSPAALRALAEAATPGPWQVDITRHPYSMVRLDGSFAEGEHVERWIQTVRIDPQAKAPYPIVVRSAGIAHPGEPPITMVHIRPEDADYLAAVSPEVVLALLDTIDSLRANLAGAEQERDALRGAMVRVCNATNGCAAESVSTEFLLKVPAEVEACIAKLRDRAEDSEHQAAHWKRWHDTVNDTLRTMAVRAEAAEACVERMRAALQEAEEVFGLVEEPSSEDPRYGAAVRALGDRIGYGALMASASAAWMEKSKLGDAYVAGPCHGTVLATLRIIRAALAEQEAGK